MHSAHAVRRNRPITLTISLSTPSLHENDSRGLRYLASLFQQLDEIFFAIWNSATQDCSKDWLLRLEYDVRSAVPIIADVSDEETANLRITQFWLQIKLWELFPRFGFLSVDSAYDCLTFRYPITVSEELMKVARDLPITSLQVHGVGMVSSNT